MRIEQKYNSLDNNVCTESHLNSRCCFIHFYVYCRYNNVQFSKLSFNQQLQQHSSADRFVNRVMSSDG